MAGEAMGTLGAGAVAQNVFANVVPRALDQKSAAVRTVRVAAVAENISFVDVVESDFAGDFPRAMQRLRRSARLVLQLEIGMERSEMERNIWAEMFENPFGEFARFVFVVIQRGNH